MKLKSISRNDEAVSEAIGYITLFGTIIIAIAIVYFNAGPVLQNTQEAQTVQNAENAFRLLDQNIVDLTQQNAPIREVQIDLQESSVRIGEDDTAWMNVSVASETFNHSIDRVFYQKVDERIVYENGALIRVSGEESAMLSSPNWLVNNDTVIVSTVETKGSGEFSGTESVRIILEGSRSETSTYLDTDFKITVNSKYKDPWETYFRDLNRSVDGEVTTTGSSVSLEIQDVDDVVYSQHTIDARLET